MATVDFVGQSRRDGDNIGAAPSRLVNFYREKVGNRFVLKSVPGQQAFCSLDDVLGRAVTEVGGALFAVSGGELYEIDQTGTQTARGAVADDSETFMEGYASNVTISAGGNYYVWDGTALSEVTGGAFTNIGSVTYVGGYTVLTEKDGSRFQWSELQDPSTLNGLYFATAEALDDGVLRAMANRGNLFLFGKQSIEIWALSGGAGENAFSRLSGGVVDRGLLAPNLVASFGEGLFFVGDDGIVYIMAGTRPQPISVRGVETAISETEPTSCYYYESEGHKFAVIRFADRPAWVFDISTGEWHERGTGNDLEAWNVVGVAKAYGGWRGITTLSDVVTLDGLDDLGQTILKKAVSTTFEGDDRRFRLRKLAVRLRTGFSNLGRDLTLLMRFSGDRGLTWGATRERSIGTQGNYDVRAVWRGGIYRNLTVELVLSENVEAPIYSDVVLDVV